jgi:hypothetical protein
MEERKETSSCPSYLHKMALMAQISNEGCSDVPHGTIYFMSDSKLKGKLGEAVICILKRFHFGGKLGKE